MALVFVTVIRASAAFAGTGPEVPAATEVPVKVDELIGVAVAVSAPAGKKSNWTDTLAGSEKLPVSCIDPVVGSFETCAAVDPLAKLMKPGEPAVMLL